MSISDFKKYPVDEKMKLVCEYIAFGSNENLENQLIQKSLQENITKYTPNDHLKRFGSVEMLKNWQNKGRNIFWLIGPNNDLAGIIWYGKSEFPLEINLNEKPSETFAIRIYDGYTGKGLANPFMTQSLRLYASEKIVQNEKLPVIWLQTDIDNIPALKSYTKFGYEEVYKDEERVTMVLPSVKVESLIKN